MPTSRRTVLRPPARPLTTSLDVAAAPNANDTVDTLIKLTEVSNAAYDALCKCACTWRLC